MNQIDRFFLWLFMLPVLLYEKAGVDTLQLRAILSAKLTMDNRRQSAFKMQNQRQEKKEINKATLATMFGAFFMGIFLAFSLMFGVDFTTRLTFFMTMFIFMLCITLITDFTSVLIDVRDNFIILPKPITDATFVASRLLHITIRTCLIVFPLSLPAFITVIVMQGWTIVLPFVLMILMSTLFSIFLINAVYILILKITTPAKFQSIISYIQIGFTIFIFAGYQLMPRMMNDSVISKTSFGDLPYIGFFPPYWFSDGCIALAKLDFSGGHLLSLALAMLIPIFSIWMVVRVFAPSFNRKLSMITARTEEKNKAIIKTGKKTKILFSERLAALFTKPGSEYMGFLFGWKMMGRSRDFKMKVYPSFGMVLVLGVLMFYKAPWDSGFHSGNGQKMIPVMLTVIYLSCLVLTTALSNLPYSEKYKASWIFYSAPVESPGKVICGAVKSAMLSFYIPIALILFVFGVVFIGPGILLNLLLGILNVLAIGAINAYITVRKLPFSAVLDGSANGGSVIKSMLPLMIMGFVGLIHWSISGYFWIVLLLLILSPFMTWLVFNEIKKLSWEKLS
jgi:ABC-2 type transport system permease protein